MMFSRWEAVDQEIYVRCFHVTFLRTDWIFNDLSLEIRESQLRMGKFDIKTQFMQHLTEMLMFLLKIAHGNIWK